MWLQYALDKDGNLVSVYDVPRGRSDIRCPYCQGELTAKKGKIKVHHFAHVRDTCDRSKNQNIDLPLFYGFNLVLNARYLKELKKIKSPEYKRRYDKEEKKIYRYFENKEIINFCGLTDLGKAILKRFSLKEYCEVQEKLSREKLVLLQNHLAGLESSIQSTIKFKQSKYYQDRPIRYQRVVQKNQKLKEEELEQAKIDFNIYCAQYRQIILNHLYFLKIETPQQTFYKIGITRRNIEERLQEIQIDLAKIFSEFSVSLLGLWLHRGNLEYYFKYFYEEFNYSLENFTEYFNFPDIEPILEVLDNLEEKQFCQLEREVVNGKTTDKFFLSLHIRQGMQRAKHKNIHIGRPKGETESTKQFLAKPKNKAIATVLKKGLSVRQTAKVTNASVNTVRKVRRLLGMSIHIPNAPSKLL
ncbi:MAG: GIY-YIG nuclease family protein [Waterburya sp.]